MPKQLTQIQAETALARGARVISEPDVVEREPQRNPFEAAAVAVVGGLLEQVSAAVTPKIQEQQRAEKQAVYSRVGDLAKEIDEVRVAVRALANRKQPEPPKPGETSRTYPAECSIAITKYDRNGRVLLMLAKASGAPDYEFEVTKRNHAGRVMAMKGRLA